MERMPTSIGSIENFLSAALDLKSAGPPSPAGDICGFTRFLIHKYNINVNFFQFICDDFAGFFADFCKFHGIMGKDWDKNAVKCRKGRERSHKG